MELSLIDQIWWILFRYTDISFIYNLNRKNKKIDKILLYSYIPSQGHNVLFSYGFHGYNTFPRG
jgi:hypothetical protein